MKKILSIIKKQYKNMYDKGAFHIFAGSFLIRFIAFFGSIFIVRVLTKQEYGTLGYVENLFSYIYLFAAMGLTYALFRYVVIAKSNKEKYSYYRYVLKKGAIFNIILIVAAILINFIYPHPDEFSYARWLVPIMLLALPFHSLTDSYISTLRAMFSNKLYAYFSFLLTFVLILTKYLLARIWGVQGAVLSNLIIYSAFAAMLGIYIKKLYFYKEQYIPLIKENKKAVDKYSIQYMITNSIWAIFMLNDIFILGFFTGNPAAVADYKIAYVLPANISLISSSIGIFASPYFIKNENNYGWIRRSYKKIYLISAVAIGAVAIGFFIFAKPLIILLYGTQYAEVAPLMKILLIAAFINCVMRYTNANLLAAMGQIKYNLIISAAGVILQILININIIPKYGSFGLAYTSIFVYFLMSIALTIVFFYKYKIIRFRK